MILKRKDFRRLMRGYEFDKKKFNQLLETYQEKEDKFTDLFEEQEKKYPEENILDRFTEYVRDSRRPDKEYPEEAFALLSNYMDEAQDAYRKCISYKGGEILSSIVEYYKSSGKRYIDIANNYIGAVDKISLPKVEGSDEELLDFSDCNTEEDVFKWTRDKLIEIMSVTIPKPVESTITRYSNNHLRSIDKGMKAFFMGEERVKPEGETIIHLEKKGKNSMTRTITMNGDVVRDGVGALGYGLFHNEVYTAISNLFYGGNRIIEAVTIGREMRHNPKARITDKEQQRIIDTIREMMIFVKMNMTSEATRYKWGEGTQTVYEGALLDVEMIITATKINGNIVYNAIKINSMPILFRLSLLKNQVVEIPNSLSDSKGIYRTDEVTKLIGYLEQRVIAGKPGKNKKQKSLSLRTIKVQTLLREVTQSTTWDRKTKVRILNSAIDILAGWKKTGFIVDYTSNIGRERREREQRILFAVSEPQRKEIREAIEK